MGKAAKALTVLAALMLLVVLFVLPAMWFMKSVLIWRTFWGYVEGVADLTGFSRYLLTAGALVLLVPSYLGASMFLSFNPLTPKWKRWMGGTMLLVLAVGYNLGLWYVMKERRFAFAGGAPQQWYAITSKGVVFFDRPGFDPQSGLPLKPVTPEIVPKLEALQRGEFRPIDPASVQFFNPNTGQAQVWYYRYPDGTLEFYDKPGHHPITGASLVAVTEVIVLEWRKTQAARLQALRGAATRGGPPVGVAGGPPAGVPSQPEPEVVEIRSDPPEAEVYVDWKRKGTTPVTLGQTELRGLVVVVREGHQAGFQRPGSSLTGPLEFTLAREGAPSRKRILLLASDGGSREAIAALRSRLVEEGFTVLGPEEAQEFERERTRAGGLSNRALRAWARARFETNLLLVSRVSQSSRDLSEQELGYLGIRDTVKGAVRADVAIDLEAVDLRSGDHLAAVAGKGSGFGLDRVQGFQKALGQAAAESARLLRQRILG